MLWPCGRTGSIPVLGTIKYPRFKKAAVKVTINPWRRLRRKSEGSVTSQYEMWGQGMERTVK